MNLPNYFIADLPPEATLSPLMLTEACQTLKRNRRQYLAGRSTAEMVNLMSEVAQHWLDPGNSFRKFALEAGPEATGFSRGTLTRGLDSFFRSIKPEALQRLLEQDLGQAQRLDSLNSSASEQAGGRASLALAPEFLAHITAGNLPVAALQGMVLGVLLRSAQFIKCASASGSTLVPRLFAHSLYQADPKLGACLEVAQWRSGNPELEQALFAETDCLTASGNDGSLAALRCRLPPRVRFVGYGHRVSFAYVTAAALTRANAANLLMRAADDVTAWNQLGCLSPHVLYVETGAQIPPAEFAELLARELDRRELFEPRGPLPAEMGAAISTRRSLYEVRAAAPSDEAETRFWASENSTAWTVIFESDPRFQLSCLNRFIYVKTAANLTEALHAADAVRGRVSTVGLAATEPEAGKLAEELGRWGAARVCSLGQMQNPPLEWRHDGQPALASLISWVDWEK